MKTIPISNAKTPFAFLLIAAFLAGTATLVQATSMQTYMTANNYSAVAGGAISGSADVARASCNSADTTWEAHESAPCSYCMGITGTGSHPITAADIPNFGNGVCFYTVTWPTDSGGGSPQAAGFSISCTNTALGYDKTGTMTIGTDCTPTTGYQNANVTIYNGASVVNVAMVQGGINYSNIQLIRQTTTQSATLHIFRGSGDTYNQRVVNYTVSGTAVSGSDYSSTGFSGNGNYTATISAGADHVDIPITVLANPTLLTSNQLVVTITAGGSTSPYQLGTTTTVTLEFLSNYPIIGVYETVAGIVRGTKGGFVFYGAAPYDSSYMPQMTVKYTLSGTASSGSDYTPSLSGTINIPAGTNQITTNILGTVQTSNFSGTKFLTVAVVANNYILDTNNLSATMVIEPGAPVVSVAATYRFASPNNSYIGQFSVTRSGVLTNACTANLNYGGTATAGSDYTALPASVQFAVNQTTTNLNVYAINSSLTTAKTVVLSLGNGAYFPGLTTNATVTLLPNSSTTNSVTSPVGEYWRGSGSDPTYWSTVVPLDTETGTVYSNQNGNCTNLYPGQTSWSSQVLYHYDATNSVPQSNVANRIQFNNPIVAFGERVGGTPLYFSQPYNFGIYAGDPALSNQPVVIQAFYRTNFQLAGSVSIYPPTLANSNAWVNFATNGFQVTTNAFGLTTILSGAPNLGWGEASKGPYVLTHTASNQATNYYYVVGVSGNPSDFSDPMVINGTGQIAPSLLYSLEFESRPPWRSVFLDQPHFNGSPLPPFYAGATLQEMLTNTPPVTNAVTVLPSQALSLDDSPELRRHPVLDNFVASMGNDPIALANYVINQIGLTDPMDYNDNGNVAEDSINPGGVTRGALGTFLEKQGSPAEQCALLVYLLRQAGVPAVYEFAPHNGLQMLDARLSQMFKFQVHGDINPAGQLYTTNTMIPVNYPWVAAYIGTNWVHIFPWLKDNEINEGLNLWEQMPTNYANAYPWVRDYFYGKTNLLSLTTDGDNTLRVIFPKYLQQTLLQNHPGVSVDDIGVHIVNRQHYYARWQDFPTPTILTNISTSITNLSSAAIANVNPSLTNIFDTMSVEIYSLTDPTKDIKTGDLRLCDLHNREFYIYQNLVNSNVQLSLILVPFRTNIIGQLAFTNDTSLLSKEVLSMTFDSADYSLGVRFKYHRHRAITPAYAIDPTTVFFGLNGYSEIDIERPLFVGDQAAICMDYGQVTRDMLNVHAADLWQMENAVSANHSLTNSISPDVYEGATMYLAGMSYYEKCDEFAKMNQSLQKFDQLSLFAAGLSKIIPARDSSGSLTNGTDPVLPCVDMFAYLAMLAGNSTLHPDSGLNYTMAGQNYLLMDIADGSAEEHQSINRFYQQTNAVSTVRLLQLAQSSGAGIVPLNYFNYAGKGTSTYQNKQLQSWDPSMWQEVVSAFQGSYSNDVTAYITPGPMTNAAYRGMAALIITPYSYSALISPASINGGFSGQPLPPDTVAAANTGNYDLSDNNGNYAIDMTAPTSGSDVLSGETAIFATGTTYNQTVAGDYVVTPVDTAIAIDEAQVMGLSPGTGLANIATDNLISQQAGSLSGSSDSSQQFVQNGDPVNDITGEFYVDETDLQLPGPIPLALRRNYSSENLANNQFGYGWKLSIMPYLSLSKNSTNIYAADMDGSVLAYVHSTSNTNLWTPTLAANPQLNNNTTAGAGGLVNRLRDYIQRSASSTFVMGKRV